MVSTPTLTAEASVRDDAVCGHIEQLLVIHVRGQRYAFALEDVQEIQQLVAIAEVPDAADGVLGMVDLRGRVVPVIDLNERLGLEPVSRSLETPMVIVHYRDSMVALVVDAVDDVLGLSEGCVQEPPPLHPLGSVMHGVARVEDGLVYVLDVVSFLDEKVSLR